ncbi:integrating conjugative element protein [Xenorhabdus bovienii]|uniref:integrating conjugative element protein n=1 Tax=Xenorhabdus bovienii TaxID=40576 RepID=UPI00237CF283|nr:integrating conjugative element protein [Xenorhabdus bovienii]MDE1485136.1 integrating conjugative element protein [Xenorhabdus bovienii]MDE9475999.1 integrating conjugative element protein [Xenorhabdus bovienii]MDE9528768.1 integrating conjugative element protein [Xenorhabdus bovienii]
MKFRLFSVLSLCVISFSSFAELEVVADLGGENTSYYFDAINNESNEWSEIPESGKIPPEQPSFEMVLPIKTPEMSPGKVIERPLSLQGVGTLFLIGDDELSRTWLIQNVENLKKLNAVGMVIQVDSANSFFELKQLGNGILLSPISGSDLAKRLQLTHYPVLITETGLTQQVP